MLYDKRRNVRRLICYWSFLSIVCPTGNSIPLLSLPLFGSGLVPLHSLAFSLSTISRMPPTWIFAYLFPSRCIFRSVSPSYSTLSSHSYLVYCLSPLYSIFEGGFTRIRISRSYTKRSRTRGSRLTDFSLIFISLFLSLFTVFSTHDQTKIIKFIIIWYEYMWYYG